ncbi:hypothetical protein ACHAWF_001219 [Thalassiosira exigua]
MESISSSRGIPPTITMAGSCDDDSLDMLMDRLQVAIDPGVLGSRSVTSKDKDASTADETYFETSTGSSSYNNKRVDEDRALDSAETSDDDDSTQSHHTNDSARFLLQQAQQRLHRQSVYEEVKVLRAEASQHESSMERTLQQKLELQNRCNALESQLAQAMETIQTHKQREARWNQERAEREKDFMNQLNDMCAIFDDKEQGLMSEILKRDRKIVELQNLWNEEEVKRIRNVRKREMSSRNSVVCEEEHIEVDLDEDSWSEECSSDFV